jgi:hypothetical protein
VKFIDRELKKLKRPKRFQVSKLKKNVIQLQILLLFPLQNDTNH